jgi:dienelactone hydrolase
MWKIIKEQRSISFVKEEVAAGLDYLRKQESVDKDKIGLVGFSYGTYLSIKTTAREDSVKALALVSLIEAPSKDEDRVQGFLSCASRPVLFLAADKDHLPQNKSNAADNSLYWSKQAKSDTKIEIRKGGWHSVELLRRKGIKEMIGDWLQKYLI